MINLKIDVKNINNEMDLIELTGELDIYTSKEFKKTVNALIKEKRAKLIVDLEKVTYIDSCGIGILLGGLKRTRDRNGDLGLIYSTKSGVWKFFDITGLYNNFSTYNTKDEAFKALNLNEQNQSFLNLHVSNSG